MRILIVEDDANKFAAINSYLEEHQPRHELRDARSFNSAMRALLDDRFDLVVLDMTLPSFDVSPKDVGGRPQAFAGSEILRQMARRGIGARVIVLTQYDRFGEGADERSLQEVDSALRDAHGPRYLGAVYYSTLSSEWKSELRSFLRILEGMLEGES